MGMWGDAKTAAGRSAGDRDGPGAPRGPRGRAPSVSGGGSAAHVKARHWVLLGVPRPLQEVPPAPHPRHERALRVRAGRARGLSRRARRAGGSKGWSWIRAHREAFARPPPTAARTASVESSRCLFAGLRSKRFSKCGSRATASIPPAVQMSTNLRFAPQRAPRRRRLQGEGVRRPRGAAGCGRRSAAGALEVSVFAELPGGLVARGDVQAADGGDVVGVLRGLHQRGRQRGQSE